jgi:hypothetical protein
MRYGDEEIAARPKMGRQARYDGAVVLDVFEDT